MYLYIEARGDLKGKYTLYVENNKEKECFNKEYNKAVISFSFLISVLTM